MSYSGSAPVSINAVRSTSGPVSTWMGDRSRARVAFAASRYIINSAYHPSVGRQNEAQ